MVTGSGWVVTTAVSIVGMPVTTPRESVMEVKDVNPFVWRNQMLACILLPESKPLLLPRRDLRGIAGREVHVGDREIEGRTYEVSVPLPVDWANATAAKGTVRIAEERIVVVAIVVDVLSEREKE